MTRIVLLLITRIALQNLEYKSILSKKECKAFRVVVGFPGSGRHIWNTKQRAIPLGKNLS